MRIITVLALAALALPMAAQAAGLTVPVNQARRLPVVGIATSVVVGNTDIADVRAVDSRTLMIVGKRQGVTNVVVLDAAGRTLFDGEINVSASAGSMITVYRGAEASDYSCSPLCGPASNADVAASRGVTTGTTTTVRAVEMTTNESPSPASSATAP